LISSEHFRPWPEPGVSPGQAANETTTLEAFHSVPFIWREQGTQVRKKVEECLDETAIAFTPQKFIELKNMATAKRLVEEGYGVTIVPAAVVERELSAGLRKELSLPWLEMKASYFFHYFKNRQPSRAAEVFLSLFPVVISLSHAENLNVSLLK